MLNVMRRHAYSWLIRAVLFLIVVVFAFWGIGTGFFAQVHPIASVDGQTILANEVDQQATRMRRTLQQIYGPNAPEALKNINLRQEALQQLIEDRLIQREARHLGLEVGTEQLQSRIASNRAFQVDGQFDFRTYEAVLRDNDMTPADFEHSERAAMLADMLRNMVEQGVQVSEREARTEFDRRNARLDLAYVEVPYAQFTGKITPTGTQLAAFYKANGEMFRQPERIKAVYIDYDPLALADKLNPSDKEIADYYQKNLKTRFSHPEQVHARHILIAVEAGARAKEKAEAKAKAQDVLRQVKAHPRDFAQLAAKYSDDPGNKFKGGDLGFFGRGEMVKPFEDAAFKLKPGEVTLVETRFGYHVLKVDEFRPAHTETLAQARPQIIEMLKRKAGDDIARRALHEDLAAALEGPKPLTEIAQKRGLKAVESPFFALDEPIPGIPNSAQFARRAFKLDVNDTRVITAPGSDSYLVKLLKREPSRIPPLKEIEPQVREAFIKEQAQKDGRDFAQSMLKQIKEAADFAKVAAGNKLPLHDTGEFSRADGTVPSIGRFQEVDDAAGAVVKIPGMIDRAMEHGGNSYLFEVVSRKAPDEAQWKKDGKAFTDRILEARREEAWTQFVNRLKQQATITVDANQLGATAESSM